MPRVTYCMILRRATESGQGVYVAQFYICHLEIGWQFWEWTTTLCGTIFTLIEGANSHYTAPRYTIWQTDALVSPPTGSKFIIASLFKSAHCRLHHHVLSLAIPRDVGPRRRPLMIALAALAVRNHPSAHTVSCATLGRHWDGHSEDFPLKG